MDNQRRRKLKAIGMVGMFYGVLLLLALLLRSIPTRWVEKYGTTLMLGGCIIVSSYILFKAALDYIEYKEEQENR